LKFLNTLLTLAFLQTSSLLANEFVGFEKGDYWQYDNEFANAKIDSNTHNWRHYTAFGPFQDVWVKSSRKHNILYTWTAKTNGETFVDFDAKVGTRFENELCAQGSFVQDRYMVDMKERIDVSCTHNDKYYLITFEEKSGIVALKRGISLEALEEQDKAQLIEANINGDQYSYFVHEKVTLSSL
jgi:hypothetical protein